MSLQIHLGSLSFLRLLLRQSFSSHCMFFFMFSLCFKQFQNKYFLELCLYSLVVKRIFLWNMELYWMLRWHGGE